MIRDPTGKDTPIHVMNNYTSHKSLACYKDPRGELKTQEKTLLDKAKEFTRVVKSCAFTRQKTNMFYRSIFLASMCYCLACTHFSRKKLDKIQSAPTCAMVSKMGYKRTTAKAILYGPWQYGGIDLHRLYDKQGINSLQQFLKHYRTRTTPIGNTTEIALAWAQYVAGTSTSIFADTTTPLPHLPAFLLGAIRQYLGTIDAQIELEMTHVAPIQRESDTHIMDWVLGSQLQQLWPSGHKGSQLLQAVLQCCHSFRHHSRSGDTH
jgi:hypothetical protein